MSLRKGIILVLAILLVAAGLFLWKMWFGPQMMFHAVATENLGRITLLTKLGIDPDVDIFLTGSPLQCAAARGSIPTMERLLSLGADINHFDGYDVTPLMVSIQHEQPEAYRWLLRKGADPFIPARNGKTSEDYLSYLDPKARSIFLKETK